MRPEPQKGEWSIPYSDLSGPEYRITFDADANDFHGEPGVVTIEHVQSVDWPASKIDWLIARLEVARDAIAARRPSTEGTD